MALTKVQIDGVEFSDSTDLNVDNGTLVVDSTNNRVGVGISSPKRLLHLNGGSETVKIQITNTATGSSTDGEGFQIGIATDGTANIEQRENADLAFFTNNTPRLHIKSDGKVGLGTSSPDRLLELNGDRTAWIRLESNRAGAGQNEFIGGIEFFGNDSSGPGAGNKGKIEVQTGNADGSGGQMLFFTGSSSTNDVERMRIDSSGRVGIGTTSPGRALEIGTSAPAIKFNNGTNAWTIGTGAFVDGSDSFILFEEGIGERLRVDNSGRLLVGTTAAFRADSFIQVKGGNSSSVGSLALASTSTNPTSGADLGFITITDTGGNRGASIIATAEGNWTSGTSQPTRLSFLTTADGASSPTERMRIGQEGHIYFGKDTLATATVGIAFQPNIGFGSFTRGSGAALAVNRQTNDGDLMAFLQADAVEGTISVSGSTVSYNGAHLSRWSQLPGGVERTEILRGSVLSNIDEMCEWGEEENEQLNRMKVSDVEGDKNVSGVFQAWDDDDDTYTNDFYCAMTGDFVIRIAEGVTVERGDLLMSAGDGTAKPQDDDIIRSKTIAKVTSTHVSETYADGSYCVPCVLMAC